LSQQHYKGSTMFSNK